MDIKHSDQLMYKLDHGWLFESKLYTSVDCDENVFVIRDSFDIIINDDHLVDKLDSEIDG